MADVRRPPDRRPSGAGGSGSHDRGQLLLVGALALAVVFVALALLLNTAIYTGNLATRDSGVEATPAIEYVSASQRAGVDAVVSVNRRNNSSRGDLNRAFDATVNRWDDLASYHRAVAGDAADTDVAGTTNGTRIQQDDAGRNFTSNTTAPDWTVVEGSGVTAVRAMRFTVDSSTLPSTDDPTNASQTAFHVTVSSPSSTRRAYVYHNNTSGNTEVLVDDDGTETVCPAGSAPDGTFVIDIANASVGGASCSAVGTLDDTEGELSIEYDDGGAAAGTYTMVVDEHTDEGDITLSGLHADGSPSPYWTHAIYSANLTVSYRTGELDYEATVEVVPE